jgi:hypothetical protein
MQGGPRGTLCGVEVWRLTMRRRIKQRKHARLKTKLGLPELEQSTAAMLVTLRSLKSQPRYQPFDQ